MSDFSDIYEDIRRLRDDSAAQPLDAPTQLRFDRLLELLHRTVLRIDMLKPLASQPRIDELRLKLLTQQIEQAEAKQVGDDFALARAIEQRFAGIDKKLDAILARLPEPPRGFGEADPPA